VVFSVTQNLLNSYKVQKEGVGLRILLRVIAIQQRIFFLHSYLKIFLKHTFYIYWQEEHTVDINIQNTDYLLYNQSGDRWPSG
jgi:hypothetical protein